MVHENQFFPMIFHANPLGDLAISGQAIPGAGADPEPFAWGDFFFGKLERVTNLFKEKNQSPSAPPCGPQAVVVALFVQPCRTCAKRSIRRRRRRKGLAKPLLRPRRVSVLDGCSVHKVCKTLCWTLMGAPCLHMWYQCEKMEIFGIFVWSI